MNQNESSDNENQPCEEMPVFVWTDEHVDALYADYAIAESDALDATIRGMI